MWSLGMLASSGTAFTGAVRAGGPTPDVSGVQLVGQVTYLACYLLKLTERAIDTGCCL